MKIAIVAAMDKELKLLLELMPDHVEREVEGQKVYEGQIGRHDVVLSKCGIGKVNSALRTYRIIHEYHPGLVINSGVAGGADSAVPIGTVLAASGAGYHDVWCGPGTEPGEADGFPRLFLPYSKGMEIVASACRTESGADDWNDSHRRPVHHDARGDPGHQGGVSAGPGL